MFENIIINTKNSVPLIHCITNYVTVNDCANMLLACGGSPIMADDENEVEDITSICNGLVINIGTLNSRTIDSMIKAGKRANELGHIVVLDPVGVGASTLRTNTTFQLLKEVKFDVIRGNLSEIKTLANGTGTTKGVDADDNDNITDDNINSIINLARTLSISTNSIIVITGAIDIVADKNNSFIIRNGNALMSKITGTGCMLTTIIAAYTSANKDNILSATAAAVCAMGLSGELSFNRLNSAGTSTYRTYIIDTMSNMTDDVLKEGMKVEYR